MHGFVGPDDGPEETVVSTENEAADRLRTVLRLRMFAHGTSTEVINGLAELDASLATERRNTVEQIRERFETDTLHDGADCHAELRALLDEVSRG